MAYTLDAAGQERLDCLQWVPWELGYADGLHRPVGVLPILTDSPLTDVYKGVEYLGLYPYVDVAEGAQDNILKPWVNKSPNIYVGLKAWLKGKKPYRHD